MTTISDKQVLSEINFLFNDVIKINVLTYAKAFEKQTPESYADAVRSAVDFANQKLAPLEQQIVAGDQQQAEIIYPKMREVWNELLKSDLWSSLVPGEYGGNNFPETVKISIQEIILRACPSFYYYLMLTLETAKMIESFGSENQVKEYCQKLYSGQWNGTISMTESHADCDWDAIELSATKKDDHYLIKGIKTLVPSSAHDLTGNIIHLVLARISLDDSQESTLAWFVVPENIKEGEKWISNNVQLHECHQTIGLQGVPFCSISFGSETDSIGYLLCETGPGKDDLYKILNGFRSQMALQSVGLAGQVFQSVLEYANHEVRPIRIGKGKKGKIVETPLISYPHVADNVMYMKTLNDGIRTAVYSIAFFVDCSLHGGKEQKEFFSDLIDLYTGVLKVHSTQLGLKSIRKGIQVFGHIAYTKENLTSWNYRNLLAGTLFGGSNEIVAQELLDRIINYEDGRLIKNLIKQFESVEVHQAKSEAMTEAIGVWQDYIGGIIVLADDLKVDADSSANTDDVDPRLAGLWANRVISLIGDVIICYHLVSLGLEAEKKLEKLGVNFFNLHQEVSRNPEMMEWYDRLLAAEYFALNVLSENEGNIRIIQRNASSALEAFLGLPE